MAKEGICPTLVAAAALLCTVIWMTRPSTQAFGRSLSPSSDKHYFAKVAGTSHRNTDRTSRCRIIRRCSALEVLQVVPEPDNPFDSNAAAHSAKEWGAAGLCGFSLSGRCMQKDFRNPDVKWITRCFAVRLAIPRRERVVGAVVVLARITKRSPDCPEPLNP